MSSVPVIEASGVAKHFAAPALVRAVRNVDLRIAAGELVALIGPSGAGKSTLLAALSGLQPPTEGRVLLNGEDASRMTPKATARLRNLFVGYVFQFHHLLPELTAIENVALPGWIALREGWLTASEAEIDERSRDLLAGVGLAARAGHLPTQLSGGEAQRVALARALMNSPAIIMADEPTGNLDEATSLELMEMIRKLNEDRGQTFLIATHNPEIMKRATRVLEMSNGELVS